MNFFPAIPVAAQTALKLAAPVAQTAAAFPKLLDRALQSLGSDQPARAGNVNETKQSFGRAYPPPELLEQLDGVSLTELESTFERIRAQFQQKLRDRLQWVGIDMFPGVRLQVQGNGTIAAMGHSDASAIQAVIQNDPQLAGELRQLAGMSSLLRAAEEHGEFAALYEQDPQMAIAQYRELFETQQSFELFVDDFGGHYHSFY